MEEMQYYRHKIEDAINKKIEDLRLVSNTNNIVLKYVVQGKNYYAKFYQNGKTHTDNELLLYENMPEEGKKYLKTLIYSNKDNNFAIYDEVKGKMLDEMLDNKEITKELANKIAKSLIDYFNIIAKIKSKNYGSLSGNFEGKYQDFETFLHEYLKSTSETLSNSIYTKQLAELPEIMLKKHRDILNEGYSVVAPIDSNFKNIMITDKDEVKVIDPGAIVSAPKAMGLGELVSHSFGTIIYEELIRELNPTIEEKKRLSIYATFSLMNIMAFLIRNNIGDIRAAKPFGNTHTFFELIKMHENCIEKNTYLV